MALLNRAATGGMSANSAVLASTGLLATFNLAVTSNARYASGKRAVSVYEGKTSLPVLAKTQKAVAKRWYSLVRLQVFGTTAALLSMAYAASPTGICRSAAAFMAANVAFFLMGAGQAKHDASGLPAPMKPTLQRFVLTTDVVLFSCAFVAALSPPASTARTVTSCIFALGCLIGAAEGAPMTVAALKRLVTTPA